MSRAQDLRATRMNEAVALNGADLLAYFGRRVSPSEDAADLLGETLVTVWRRVADLPSDELRARMWMFGVARRVLANYNRGNRRRWELASKLRRELAAHPAEYASRVDHSDIWADVDALPGAQRELIVLVHGDGFTVTEAARVLSISASTARTRYATALKALQLAYSDGESSGIRL